MLRKRLRAWPVGILRTLDADRPRVIESYHPHIDNQNGLTDWESLAEALGDVVVPPGKLLGLRGSPDGAKDFSPLTKLAPDDLHTPCFFWPKEEGRKAGDGCMPHVAYQRGLRVLNLQGTSVTDRGLSSITGLRALERLSLPEGIGGEGLGYINEFDAGFALLPGAN